MAEMLDNTETGEITALPRMPPEIAKAVLAVMAKVKQLGSDERNSHGGYDYVSVDKFMSSIRPLMVEAEILLTVHEDAVEVKSYTTKKGDEGSYLFLRFACEVVHSSGACWGPIYRSLALPATGPQAYGSAESYVLKRFMRALFLVPTGDKDADETASGEMPARERPQQPRGGATKANPAVQAPAPQDALEPAKAAYKAINQAIAGTQTVNDLRLIYDGFTEEWMGEYAQHAAAIMKADGSIDAKDHLARAAERHKARFQALVQREAEDEK